MHRRKCASATFNSKSRRPWYIFSSFFELCPHYSHGTPSLGENIFHLALPQIAGVESRMAKITSETTTADDVEMWQAKLTRAERELVVATDKLAAVEGELVALQAAHVAPCTALEVREASLVCHACTSTNSATP